MKNENEFKGFSNLNEIEICESDELHLGEIGEVRQKLPTDEDLYDLSDFFKVLGDSTRMKILWALDIKELCVCDLAEILKMTKSAVSHQLKLLKSENFVKYRKSGKNVFYSLTDEHIKNICEISMEHVKGC